MPLASRATQNRAQRTEAAAKANTTDGENESTQPRRPSQNASKPALAPEPKAAIATPEPPEDKVQKDAEPPAAPARKPRADKGVARPRPAPAAVSGDAPTASGLRLRMRDIEVAFKELKKKQAGEERDMRTRHQNERIQMQGEHAALSKQLSSLVFKG